MNGKIAEAYLYGRASAAHAGSVRLSAELAALVPGYEAGALATRLDALEEARRAHRAARGYTNTWLRKALDLADEGVEQPGPAAHGAVEKRLAIGADVEAADAFYEARADALDDAVRQNPGLVEVLEQVWSVAWCERTCERCAELDGMTRPLNEHFPHGNPRLHPHCGCEIDIEPRS